MYRSAWVSLLLLLAAGPAGAAHWINITEGPPRAIYLDTEALQRDGHEVRAWMREVYLEEHRSEHTGVIYYSANSLMRFDCPRHISVPLMRVFYGSDGTELRRIRLDDVEAPAIASPGSLQEHLLERACQPEKKPVEKAAKIVLADAKPKTDVPATDAKKPAESDGEKPTGVGAKAEKAPATAAVPPAAKPPVDATKSVKEAPKPPKEAPKAEVAKPETKAPAPKPALPQQVSAKYTERVAVLSPPTPYVNPRDTAARRIARPPKKIEKPVEAEHVHWSYEGKGSPQRWGELSPDNAACGSGKRQSPIDIADGAKLELEPVKFDYKPSALRIVDNGYTVQVNYAEGSFIVVEGVRYDLKQFHFHKPSEERIDGRAYDMVVHLVHRSPEGRLAVVAVLMEAGAPNPFLKSLWPYLPLESGREIAPPEVSIDLNALLPEQRGYYAYMGSLTTPPCSEGVLWLVLKTPVNLSPEQVGVFGKLYSMNARPIQPSNGRLIKESL